MPVITNDDERKAFITPYSPADDVILAQWVKRLSTGETEPKSEGIARRIAHDFINRALLDLPQSKVALAWLAESLNEIFNRWFKCAVTLCGYTPAEARALAAGCFHRSEKTIDRYVQQRNASLDQRDWAAFFQGRGRPLPRPKRRKRT